MRIKTRIEAVASDDATREAIQNPYFDGKNLVATNGWAIAVIPAEELDAEGETVGPIPVEAIKESRKGKKSLKGLLNCGAEVSVTHSEAKFPRKELKFPDYQKACFDTLPMGTVPVRINANLLKDLADALIASEESERKVELWIDPTNPKAPILVVPYGSQSQAKGILMPLR